MCEEPTFLDDETLTDNLDDAKASRVLNWLITVFKKSPSDIEHAIFLVREINKFYKEKTEENKADHLVKIESYCTCSFCGNEIHDSDIFERIMTQLEDKYVEIK